MEPVGILVGVGNLTVRVLDDVDHLSMLAPGPKAQERSAFIQRAMQLTFGRPLPHYLA